MQITVVKEVGQVLTNKRGRNFLSSLWLSSVRQQPTAPRIRQILSVGKAVS